MEIDGIVQHGVIVPQGECPLPEGTRVRIVDAEKNGSEAPLAAEPRSNQVAERLQDEFAAWAQEDEADGADNSADDFFRLLDEDRPSERKLFPDDLKGVTW